MPLTALKYNPYLVFQSSQTPAGLYARQKWLKEAGTPGWLKDYDRTVKGLSDGQSRDGSWKGSVIETIRRLFGLHLTVRDPTPPVVRALDWLFTKIEPSQIIRPPATETPLTADRLAGLPFTVGASRWFELGAALFLSTIFGRENDPPVLEAYRKVLFLIDPEKKPRCGWAGSYNLLRALVVNPEFSQSKEVRRFVAALAKNQDISGRWRVNVPFYQTVNALAHLNLASATAQGEKAFKRLCVTQNRNGTWGSRQREWNTFLVIHALLNRKGARDAKSFSIG